MLVYLLVIIVSAIIIWINRKELARKQFKTVLDDSKEGMTHTTEEIIKLRADFAESILTIQTDIEELKAKIDINNKNKDEVFNIEVKRIDDDINYNSNQKIDYIEDEREVLGAIIGSNGYNIDKKYGKKHKKSYENVSRNTTQNETNSDKSVKIQEIAQLLDNGLTIEQICSETGIGKGEILLIKELYLK